MKAFTIIHVLVFLLFLLVYQCAGAQDYLLSTRGDSIAGDVKPMAFGTDKKVQVVSNGQKTVLPLVQVKAFRYRDEMYHPVKGDRGYDFMKVIKNGYLSLYAFQMEGQFTYDGLYLVKKDGSRMEVPNLSFKKFVSRFLGDCPQVSEKIQTGEYNKKKLFEIVDEYNACVDERTVNHKQVIVQRRDQEKKIGSWDDLEKAVKEKEEFNGKNDALEMIAEIKGKINRNEKVPNFLIEGLKNALSSADLDTELESAIAELNRD